jgi:hypothetical protein
MAFGGLRFLGLDALGCHSLFAPLHRKVLTGYALAAQAEPHPPEGPAHAGREEVSAVAALWQRVERIHCGSGSLGEYSILGGPLRGGELVHDGRLVHLSVLPAAGRGPREDRF